MAMASSRKAAMATDEGLAVAHVAGSLRPTAPRGAKPLASSMPAAGGQRPRAAPSPRTAVASCDAARAASTHAVGPPRPAPRTGGRRPPAAPSPWPRRAPLIRAGPARLPLQAAAPFLADPAGLASFRRACAPDSRRQIRPSARPSAGRPRHPARRQAATARHCASPVPPLARGLARLPTPAPRAAVRVARPRPWPCRPRPWARRPVSSGERFEEHGREEEDETDSWPPTYGYGLDPFGPP